METFIQTVLGDIDAPVFLAYCAIAYFVAFLMLIIRADKKRKDSPDTPSRFEWGFFFQDNLLKFLINFLSIPLAVRFSGEIMGSEITGWLSVLIGAGINSIVVGLQNLENSTRK